MSQNKIYVGSLSYDVTAAELDEFFQKFGTIENTKLIIDHETKKSKGFAFITFETSDAAEASLDANGTELRGRKIRVNKAKEDNRRRRI